VGFDGRLGDEERLGDLGVGEAAGDVGEDLEFALAEFGEVGRCAGGGCGAAHELFDEAARDGGGEKGVAGGDGADGVGELLGADVLDEKAAGAGLHGLVDVLVEVEGGEDEDACGAVIVQKAARGLEPVEFGHADVHEDHVGCELAGACEGLESVGRLADDLDVLLGFEDHPKAAAHERLVVGDEHPDHGLDRSGSCPCTA
jgi:hypothetical protein